MVSRGIAVECSDVLATKITEYIDNPIDNEFIFTCTYDILTPMLGALVILCGFATLYLPQHEKIINIAKELW